MELFSMLEKSYMKDRRVSVWNQLSAKKQAQLLKSFELPDLKGLFKEMNME